MKPKLFIATPAYDGKVYVDYCPSLIATLQVLDKAGIAYELGLENGDCYVAKARNKLARMFLDTDCTHLLFVDADVGWDVSNIAQGMITNYDICLGAYPMKEDEPRFPINLITDENGRVKNEGLNIEITMGPTGFMCVRREVFEKIKANNPQLEYMAKPDVKEWNFFHCDVMNRQWWGEDFDFCMKASKEGFGIWCYTDINFRHWGLEKWKGNCKAQLDANSTHKQ